MTAVTETNGDVFFYGGDDGRKAQQDTWKLKLATNEWEQLPDGAEPKWAHSADIVGPLVVLLGGDKRGGGQNELSLA